MEMDSEDEENDDHCCRVGSIDSAAEGIQFMLGLSPMGPSWLALSTSKGKARGPGSWALNLPIVYLSL